MDAHFLNALQIGSNSLFADSDGNIQILPGNQIPAIPRHRIKAAIDYAMMELDGCANQIEISRSETPDRIENKLTKANCTKLPELFQPFEKKGKCASSIATDHLSAQKTFGQIRDLKTQ